MKMGARTRHKLKLGLPSINEVQAAGAVFPDRRESGNNFRCVSLGAPTRGDIAETANLAGRLGVSAPAGVIIDRDQASIEHPVHGVG